MYFSVSHRPSIQHGRPTPSHRPALTLARCSAPADFASLRVLGAPAASRPPTLASSLVALPASLGSSYRPALRWPGILGLRSASRCSSIRNGRPAAPDGLQFSFAHWAYFGLFRALRAASVRPSPLHPFGASTATACFRHRRRPSCAPRHCHPYQFPLKSCGFSGVETAKKRFLLWKMGFSGAACCEPMHPSIQHGRSTALAGSLAALPASLGLLRAVSRTARALRAPPPYTPPGTIEARKGFAPLALSHGFLPV